MARSKKWSPGPLSKQIPYKEEVYTLHLSTKEEHLSEHHRSYYGESGKVENV
jgi:hypothetical protein